MSNISTRTNNSRAINNNNNPLTKKYALQTVLQEIDSADKDKIIELLKQCLAAADGKSCNNDNIKALAKKNWIWFMVQ